MSPCFSFAARAPYLLFTQQRERRGKQGKG